MEKGSYKMGASDPITPNQVTPLVHHMLLHLILLTHWPYTHVTHDATVWEPWARLLLHVMLSRVKACQLNSIYSSR